MKEIMKSIFAMFDFVNYARAEHGSCIVFTCTYSYYICCDPVETVHSLLELILRLKFALHNANAFCLKSF